MCTESTIQHCRYAQKEFSFISAALLIVSQITEIQDKCDRRHTNSTETTHLSSGIPSCSGCYVTRLHLSQGTNLRKTSYSEAPRKTKLRNFSYCEVYASRQPLSCKQAKNTGRVFSESFILLCLGPGEGCLLSKQECRFLRRPVANKVGICLLMALRARPPSRNRFHKPSLHVPPNFPVAPSVWATKRHRRLWSRPRTPTFGKHWISGS